MKVCFIIDQANRIFVDSIEQSAKKIGLVPYVWLMQNSKPYGPQRADLESLLKEQSITRIITFNNFQHGEDFFFQDTLFAHGQVILWSIDPLLETPVNIKNIHHFTEVYSFEPQDIPFLRDTYQREAHYLPFTVGEDIFCSHPMYRESERHIDVSFIGLVKGNQKRLSILNEVAKLCQTKGLHMALYGSFWHDEHWYQRMLGKYRFKKAYPYLAPFVINRRVSPVEATDIYGHSKICLNIHTEGHTGPNCRTFEVLGNSNFLLTDAVDVSGVDLVEDIHLAMYRTPQEAAEKVLYYIEHRSKRQVMASAGGQLVRGQYTLTDMLQVIMNTFKL